jgi:NifU-like protein involved in Fe-S cluster formation
MPSTAAAIAALTPAALGRLKAPRRRGRFAPIDAARRRLGLLSAGDGAGQARVFWLIDLAAGTVADARFLAFGEPHSHPAADALCELAIGRSVADACALGPETIAAHAGLDAAQTAFITPLQARLLAALPTVELLPEPVEKQVYQRKRQQDWDERDRAWLPLSLLKKIARVDAIAARVLAERLPQAGASAVIEGLHDDLAVKVRFDGIPAEQHPMIAGFLKDALRADVHPQIEVMT